MATKLATPLQATALPLPASLGGISVAIQGAQTYQAPLFSIRQTSSCGDAAGSAPDCILTAITIQAPFEIQGTSSIGAASVSISENGVASRSFAAVVTDDVHILTSCDAIFGATGQGGGSCLPVVTHADGTAVSPNSQVRPGETVVIYATGLGQTNPPATTGAALSNPAPIVGNLAVQLNYYPNAGPARPYYLGPLPPHDLPAGPPIAFMVPGYVGLYQINVPVGRPTAGTPLCLGGVLSNLTINVGFFGEKSFDGAPICVTP
jgi:uncharacterized protein (TIGR03437 family)